MQETLNQALQGLLDAIITTKDFVIEQAPDVIQQLLAWQFTISLIGFVVLILTLVAIWTIGLFIRKKTEGNFDKTMTVLFTALASVIPLVLFPLALDWLKILIAPKVFLIEYIANMIK